jgi:alpha-L-rhamnosidase
MKNFCFFFCFLFLLAACDRQTAIKVSNLRCEMLSSPQGIDLPAPRLSWEISGEERNIRQTVYRILVASSLEKLNIDEGDLWDSQYVKSGASVNVLYNGKKLESRTDCY